MSPQTTLFFLVAILCSEDILASKMKIVILRSTGLTKVPESTSLCNKCQSLDLSENNIKYLSKNNFVSFKTIRYLYLSENDLSTVDSNAFSGLNSLELLDLSSNKISHLDSVTFNVLPGLKRLILRKNPLMKASFKSNSLTSLDLSHCLFETISADMFSGLAQLETVDLNHNLLHSVDVKVVDTLSRITNVDLEENPWKCDCLIYNLTNKNNYDEELECLTDMGNVIPWSQLKCPKKLIENSEDSNEDNKEIYDDYDDVIIDDISGEDEDKTTTNPQTVPELNEKHTSDDALDSKPEEITVKALSRKHSSKERLEVTTTGESDATEAAFDVIMYMMAGAMVLIIVVLVVVTAMLLPPLLRQNKRGRRATGSADEEDAMTRAEI